MENQKSSFRAFARLFKHHRSYQGDFYLGTLYSFLNKLFDIAPEILIGVAIDVVVNQEQSFLARFGISEPFHQLMLLSVLTLMIWGFESLFEYLLLLKWRGLAQNLQHDFRVEAYQHLQKLDMVHFEEERTGRLVAILNDDINQLERFLNEGMNNLVQVMTAVTLIGAVFFVLAPTVAIFAFLPIPIILMAAFYFQKQAAPLYADVREKAGLISSRLADNISGISTIRSFVTEAREASLIESASKDYVSSNARAIRISSRFNPLIRMAVLAGFLSTFVIGGWMTLNGQLNVGSYGVLVFLTQRLLWPLTSLASTVDLFERAMASADRVLDLLALPVQVEAPVTPAASVPVEKIEFENVQFSYPSSKEPVLNDLSFQLLPGQTVAFVGMTGSGKSTITKLLLGFYRPTSGRILIEGRDLRELDLKAVRDQIGWVSQDVFLFPGTVAENIAYGRPSATDSEILEAARKASALEFIEKLPQGLATPIGERGQKLSGGQRQRLSLARAILKDPRLLILDEATSAVDNETERLIQKALKEVARGRTTLVIAHRLSTVTQADRIDVLSEGRRVETGLHEELLRAGGIYQQLWSRQMQEQE